MLVEVLAIAGSIWVGKRVYAAVTPASPPPRGIICPSSDTLVSAPRVRLPAKEQAACKHLAVAASGLTLALSGALAAAGLLALLAIPVLASGFAPLIRDGWRDLRGRGRVNYGMFFAIVTIGGIASGYPVLIGVFEVVSFGSEVLLAKTRRRARQCLGAAFAEWPVDVWVMRGEFEVSVSLVELAVGDIIVVRAGELIPVDGTVVAGAGGVDQSMVTGESVVAETALGDKVFASTLLLSGRLEIRVERAGKETLTGQISELLERMDSFEASVEHRSVKLADASVNPTLAVSAIGWVARGPLGALTVAASNFADANRLASPLSMFNYLIAMSDAGIQVKDGRSLELLGEVDTVVFDKTGTLTFGSLSVVYVGAAEGYSDHQILALAAAAEERQQHPIAAAILHAARVLDLEIPAGVTETNSVGNGIAARVEGSRVLVGSRRYMQHEGISIPFEALAEEEQSQVVGQTFVHVARDQQWVGGISMRSSARPEAAHIVARLRADGYRTVILSGDHAGPTRRFAEGLGVDGWRAGVLPHEKTQFIEHLQATGHKVCFVGDGINDGMALKTANVSVTLSGASMVATETAQIILQEGALAKLQTLFELSDYFRSDQRVIRRSMVLNSTLSAVGALFFGLPLPVVYLFYFGTVATSVAVAVSPQWRRLEPANPPVRSTPAVVP